MPLPYPQPTSSAVSAAMRGNRSLDSKPELALRSLLHRAGYRFRKHRVILTDDLRVRPDLVFVQQRVAIFVDGCFWHGCPQHGRKPRVNEAYWTPKLERNQVRDKRVDAALQKDGWAVIRIWEHDPPAVALRKVGRVLERRI
jgi:DNA mismatch endonuclease, patch repair protein